MEDSRILERHAQLLLQLGIVLILFSACEGFLIPYLGSQRIGLSVHTLSALQCVLLLGLGLVWPKLKFNALASRIAFWTLVYSTLAILAAYTIAATWGVGNDTIRLMGELPHGLRHGSAFQESVIKIVAYSSAPTGLIALGLVLWGLRGEPVVSSSASTNG
jgi:hydroxylaminobenzene mutase